MKDPTDLNEIEQDLAEVARLARIEREQEVSDLKRTLSSELGRRFMRRLLEQSGVFRLSYVEGDAMATVFREGQRSWGNRQAAIINEHYPELWQAMFKERTQ